MACNLFKGVYKASFCIMYIIKFLHAQGSLDCPEQLLSCRGVKTVAIANSNYHRELFPPGGGGGGGGVIQP